MRIKLNLKKKIFLKNKMNKKKKRKKKFHLGSKEMLQIILLKKK